MRPARLIPYHIHPPSFLPLSSYLNKKKKKKELSSFFFPCPMSICPYYSPMEGICPHGRKQGETTRRRIEKHAFRTSWSMTFWCGWVIRPCGVGSSWLIQPSCFKGGAPVSCGARYSRATGVWQYICCNSNGLYLWTARCQHETNSSCFFTSLDIHTAWPVMTLAYHYFVNSSYITTPMIMMTIQTGK